MKGKFSSLNPFAACFSSSFSSDIRLPSPPPLSLSLLAIIKFIFFLLHSFVDGLVIKTTVCSIQCGLMNHSTKHVVVCTQKKIKIIISIIFLSTMWRWLHICTNIYRHKTLFILYRSSVIDFETFYSVVQ